MKMMELVLIVEAQLDTILTLLQHPDSVEIVLTNVMEVVLLLTPVLFVKMVSLITQESVYVTCQKLLQKMVNFVLIIVP
jgi:hypothetical protein